MPKIELDAQITVFYDILIVFQVQANSQTLKCSTWLSVVSVLQPVEIYFLPISTSLLQKGSISIHKLELIFQQSLVECTHNGKQIKTRVEDLFGKYPVLLIV